MNLDSDDPLEMETLHEPAQQSHSSEVNSKDLKRRDYFIGIGLLLTVVLLWTISNFVTQVQSYSLLQD